MSNKNAVKTNLNFPKYTMMTKYEIKQNNKPNLKFESKATYSKNHVLILAGFSLIHEHHSKGSK